MATRWLVVPPIRLCLSRQIKPIKDIDLVTCQKLASRCSQVIPKSSSIYTGNKKTITLFLLMESIVLVLLAVLAQFCCIFWKKKKLQGLDLGKFLEKRRWLRSRKRALDRMITEVEQKASEEGDGEQVMEKLNDLVKGRESIYSLGRDDERSRAKSLLPLHDGKSRSYSFQGSKKESVAIFHTLSSDDDDESSSTSDSGELSSLMEEADEDLSQDKVGVGANEEETSCSDDDERVCMKPLFLEHSFKRDDDGGESRSLRRRTVSFNGQLPTQFLLMILASLLMLASSSAAWLPIG